MIAVPDILIICVGILKDRHCRAMTDDFLARLKHEARLQILEVRDSNKLTEGKQIVALLDKHTGMSFALGEEGMVYTSRTFAAMLQQTTRKIIFIIGGPDGLSDEVKKRADKVLSLSPFTFTHEMARMLLSEQLYRACTILHNRAYHRD